nr:RNA-directed DNA polymerase, eukaryota [Tanacetum cinerariifolium]
GDPLSPFLFILVMESLHLSFQNVVDGGLFKGVALNDSLQISYLFYADDVVFIGQWCESNIATIIRVLDCFYRALGLHINLHKSKLLGLAVENDLVNLAANSIGCMTLSLPFSYLGVNIGGHMSRISSWDVVIDNVRKRLSKWKMKVLSVGGRLKLLKSVLGSTPIYYMSMFIVPMHVINKLESIRSHLFNGVDPNVRNTSFIKRDNVLASKEKGGLGVSSFFSINRALIFKWIWGFRSQSNSLWSRVIKALHGEDGKLDQPFKSNFTSNWADIIRSDPSLYNKGIDLLGFMKKKESNNRITVEEKMKHPSLVSSFHRNPRGGIEQVQMDALSIILEDLILPNMKDRWSWSFSGDGEFSVSTARSFIDAKTLGTVGSKTQWCKYVPIKINILSWRVKLNNLPTRLSLSRRDCAGRGDIVCATCNAGQEPGIYKEGQMSQCASCYGRGLIAHRDGSDTICVKCNGKGKIPCATCGSRGLVKCLKCEGSGSLLTRKIAVVKWNTHSTRKLNATSGAASVPDDVFHRAKGVQLCNTQAYHCTPAFFADSFFLNQFIFTRQ